MTRPMEPSCSFLITSRRYRIRMTFTIGLMPISGFRTRRSLQVVFDTSRRTFQIAVSGMEEAEAKELIRRTAVSLGIPGELGGKETAQIIEESDGHPYVIKIILGEIADKGSFGKPSQILARKEEILEALFERTYNKSVATSAAHFSYT